MLVCGGSITTTVSHFITAMINAVAACVQGPPQYTDGINALQGFKCITCSALIPMSRWDNYIELYVACSSAVYTVYMHA